MTRERTPASAECLEINRHELSSLAICFSLSLRALSPGRRSRTSFHRAVSVRSLRKPGRLWDSFREHFLGAVSTSARSWSESLSDKCTRQAVAQGSNLEHSETRASERSRRPLSGCSWSTLGALHVRTTATGLESWPVYIPVVFFTFQGFRL